MAANFKKAGEGGMAGNWIKMRTNLATHPKVVRMASALRADRLRIIGGLHAVWCLFDEHSTDGRLDGYSLEIVDDLIGFPGFASAMLTVGWLVESGESLATPDFDEHNGQSAKRRAQESDRKRTSRASASDADKSRTKSGPEKRREDISTTPVSAGVFEIHDDWQPSENFPATLLMAGIHAETHLTAAALTEFILFRKSTGERLSQAQWDHKFFQTIQSNSKRSGGSHANGKGASRALTSYERVQQANGPAAAGQPIEGDFQRA